MQEMGFNLNIASIRTLSVLITVGAVWLVGSFEAFYSLFLAFTLSHVLLAFYFSYPRFKSLSHNKQSLLVAALISLVGVLVTFMIYPSIALIFIVHEIFSEIFMPSSLVESSMDRILKDRRVKVLRLLAGFFGLCYLARDSNYILFTATPEWALIFVIGLLALFLRVSALNENKRGSVRPLLNAFSFEWVLLSLVILSYTFQITCAATHIAFYHVFFWLFLVLKEAKASDKKSRYFPIWLHLSTMLVFWLCSPVVLRHFGYLSAASYPLMLDFYANLVLLTVSAHIFSSFYLSKYNPIFLQRILSKT